MADLNFETHDKILLTGAGFTHNFGAPLAKHVWTFIFNHPKVQSNRDVLEKLRSDFDFESVYYRAIYGGLTPFLEREEVHEAEKEVISAAVSSAYERIDRIVKRYQGDLLRPADVTRFLELIARDREKKAAFIFTLNQDLFVERKCWFQEIVAIPGIKNNSDWFSSRFETSDLDRIQLPCEKELDNRNLKYPKNNNFFYIKLHGSSNWVDSAGNQKMVIGKAKEGEIENEPLLKWYLQIFNNVLSRPNQKLLVIGYGFGDQHINRIIAEAVKKYGLRIYIVNPTDPEHFFDGLTVEKLFDIKNGVAGYFPYTLSQIFPGNRHSEAQHELRELFLEFPSGIS